MRASGTTRLNGHFLFRFFQLEFLIRRNARLNAFFTEFSIARTTRGKTTKYCIVTNCYKRSLAAGILSHFIAYNIPKHFIEILKKSKVFVSWLLLRFLQQHANKTRKIRTLLLHTVFFSLFFFVCWLYFRLALFNCGDFISVSSISNTLIAVKK